MKLSDVTFGEFDKVLTELGFRLNHTEEGHRLYRHDETDTVVPLPGAPDDAFVPLFHILANATILDGRGVVTRERFQQMLSRRKVA